MRIGLPKAVAIVFAVATLVIGAGTLWEYVERGRATRDYPPRGRLVDIGGRRIQIDCRGVGEPTVIFESGLGIDGAMGWAAVHDEAAAVTRACAYSRAGLLWSDDKPGPHDGRGVADDLQATLDAAGEKAPFVLVGQSLGGIYITLFAKRYAATVSGLVYVDPTPLNRLARIEAATGKPAANVPTIFRIGAALPWSGLTRALASVVQEKNPDIPEEVGKVIGAYTPTSLRAALSEWDAAVVTLSQAGASIEFGARPVVVLTRGAAISPVEAAAAGLSEAEKERLEELIRSAHGELASWSFRGKHEIVEGPGHLIQFEKPDAVIAAVRRVVEETRAPGSHADAK